MGSVTLIGGSIIVATAFVTDPAKTVGLVIVVITVRGVTFLAKRITQTINKDCSDIIDFSGWALASLSIVPLLKLSLSGLYEISDSIKKVHDTITGIGIYFQKFANIVDKLTPWK